MSEQTENLERVNAAIGKTILEFRAMVGVDTPFHCSDMRDFVITQHPFVAPASPDRILRLLRKEGALDYIVVSRSASLYEFKS